MWLVNVNMSVGLGHRGMQQRVKFRSTCWFSCPRINTPLCVNTSLRQHPFASTPFCVNTLLRQQPFASTPFCVNTLLRQNPFCVNTLLRQHPFASTPTSQPFPRMSTVFHINYFPAHHWRVDVFIDAIDAHLCILYKLTFKIFLVFSLTFLITMFALKYMLAYLYADVGYRI